MTHEVMRRCRVCRTARVVGELQRWTVQDAKLVPDEGRKATGRGYYSCSSRCSEILPKTIKTLKKV